MAGHHISLSFTTTSLLAWEQIYNALSITMFNNQRFAENVVLTSVELDGVPIEKCYPVVFTENTRAKVLDAISPWPIGQETAEQILHRLDRAGIEFRERAEKE